jgi:hypothetical protein
MSTDIVQLDKESQVASSADPVEEQWHALPTETKKLVDTFLHRNHRGMQPPATFADKVKLAVLVYVDPNNSYPVEDWRLWLRDHEFALKYLLRFEKLKPYKAGELDRIEHRIKFCTPKSGGKIGNINIIFGSLDRPLHAPFQLGKAYPLLTQADEKKIKDGDDFMWPEKYVQLITRRNAADGEAAQGYLGEACDLGGQIDTNLYEEMDELCRHIDDIVVLHAVKCADEVAFPFADGFYKPLLMPNKVASEMSTMYMGCYFPNPTSKRPRKPTVCCTVEDFEEIVTVPKSRQRMFAPKLGKASQLTFMAPNPPEGHPPKTEGPKFPGVDFYAGVRLTSIATTKDSFWKVVPQALEIHVVPSDVAAKVAATSPEEPAHSTMVRSDEVMNLYNRAIHGVGAAVKQLGNGLLEGDGGGRADGSQTKRGRESDSADDELEARLAKNRADAVEARLSQIEVDASSE